MTNDRSGEHEHQGQTYEQKQNSFAKWSTILGFTIIMLVQVAGFSYVNHSPDDATKVLCTGIIANTANVARDDPLVVSVCTQLGINRADYPPTEKP